MEDKSRGYQIKVFRSEGLTEVEEYANKVVAKFGKNIEIQYWKIMLEPSSFVNRVYAESNYIITIGFKVLI